MEADQNWVKFFGRHLVAITYLDRSPERRDQFHGGAVLFQISGFLVSIRGVWCLMTAGHVLRDIETALGNGQQLTDFALDDTFGSAAVHQNFIPFNFRDARKVWHDQDGLDLGAIILSPHHVRLLQKNGADAMSEEQWEGIWPEKFDHFILIGFPSQLIRRQAKPGVYSRSVAHIIVRELEAPPPQLETVTPRFYGRVFLEKISDGELTDIDGMSGGPIIALKRMDDGQLRYWLYAVQSSWPREEQIIAAVPLESALKRVAAGIDVAIAEILADGQDDESTPVKD